MSLRNIDKNNIERVLQLFSKLINLNLIKIFLTKDFC